MIETSLRDGVARIRLAKSVTNPIEHELVDALRAAIAAARANPAVAGIVLGSGNDKFFSIGLDLPALVPLPRDDLASFLAAFHELFVEIYSLEMPVALAQTGHAIAGGCVLALAADRRIVADGRNLTGLNEGKLGLPLPWAADCALRALVTPEHAKTIITEGAFHEPPAALALGLVDEIRSLEAVWPAAVEWAGRAHSPETKRDRVEPVLAEIEGRRAERLENFLDRWFAPDTQAKLRGAMESF